MVTCALPFVIILIGVMVSWALDLRNDPLMIRRRYALEALRRGVSRGIDEHGDDFVFDVAHVEGDQGAGAAFESDNPALTEWYTETATMEVVQQLPADSVKDDAASRGVSAAEDDDDRGAARRS